MRITITFIVYLLVGELIHWGSLFIVFGILGKICEDDIELWKELYGDFLDKRIGINMGGWPEGLKFVVTQVLWPISVFNTLCYGVPKIFEAKRRMKDEDLRR